MLRRSVLFTFVLTASVLFCCCAAREAVQLANAFACAKHDQELHEGVRQVEKDIQVSSVKASPTMTEPIPILLTRGKVEFTVVHAESSEECSEFKIKDSKGCRKEGTVEGSDSFSSPPSCGQSCKGFSVVCTVAKPTPVEEYENGAIAGLRISDLFKMFQHKECKWDVVIKNARVLTDNMKQHGTEPCVDTYLLPIWAWAAIGVGAFVVLLCIVICVLCIVVAVQTKSGQMQQHQSTQPPGSQSMWQRAASTITGMQQRFVVIRARPKKAATGAAIGAGGRPWARPSDASLMGAGGGGGMTTGSRPKPSAYAGTFTKAGAPSSKYGFM